MRIFERKKGDVLQPSRFTPGVVRGLKQKSREWSGQYQQEPHPASGIIFQPAWWKYYRSRDPLPDFDIVAISVDCAFKSAAENDFVAIQKWGGVGARSYLLEYQKEHLGFVGTKAAIKAMYRNGLRASAILIEDRANGTAIIEELKADPDFGAAVIAIEPEGGKESRAYAASADCEAGNVYLPEDADWLAPFLRTAAAFPTVKHDDDIDALTQFLNWRRKRNESLGFVDLLKRRALEIGQGVRDAFGELIHRRAPKPAPVAVMQKPAAPAIARAEGSKGVVDAPPCPVCRSTSTIRAAVAGGCLCNQCQVTFDVRGNVTSKPKLVIGEICWVEGCGLPLVTSAGHRRCQNHGQAPEEDNQAAGMSRSDYFSGSHRRKR